MHRWRGNKMYIDSGGGTPANLYEAGGTPSLAPVFTRPPTLPICRCANSSLPRTWKAADAHGAAAHEGRQVPLDCRPGPQLPSGWSTPTTDEVVNTRRPATRTSRQIRRLICSRLSPNGSHAFTSLRGPNPLDGGPARQHRINARRRHPEGTRRRPSREIRIHGARDER